MQTCSSHQDCWYHLSAGSGADFGGSTVAQGMSKQERQAGAQGLASAPSGVEKVVCGQAGSDHGGGAGSLGAAAGSAQGAAASGASCVGEAASQAAKPGRPPSAAKGTKRAREAEELPCTTKRARLAGAPEPGRDVHAVSTQAGAGIMQWEVGAADAAAVLALGGAPVPAPHAAGPAGAEDGPSQGAAQPTAPTMLEQGQ